MEKLPSAGRQNLYQGLKLAGVVFGVAGAITMVLTKPGSSDTIASLHDYQAKSCTGDMVHVYEFKTSSSCVQLSLEDRTLYGKATCDSGSNASVTLQVYSDETCINISGSKLIGKPGICYNDPLLSNGMLSNSSALFSCDSLEAKNQVAGTILLLGNCASMAVYVLLQKYFIFNPAERNKLENSNTRTVARFASTPIGLTAYSCMLIALFAHILFKFFNFFSPFLINRVSRGGESAITKDDITDTDCCSRFWCPCFQNYVDRVPVN